jgi:hypothetical protein
METGSQEWAILVLSCQRLPILVYIIMTTFSHLTWKCGKRNNSDLLLQKSAGSSRSCALIGEMRPDFALTNYINMFPY